jgi:aryl-alcohol dehydrogenase-like predicted oxidoreductase
VLGQPQVAVALTGARNPQEIEDNVAAIDLVLSPDERNAIDAIMADAAGQVNAVPT